jgi:hypothetical protein
MSDELTLTSSMRLRNGVGSDWEARPPGRGDVHQDDVAGVTLVNYREKRRIADKAAIPIALATDLDRVYQER